MSNEKYPKLFEPLKIGKLNLPCRVVMPPMTTSFAQNGFVTDTMINFYAARAKGGVGLIIVEDCIVDNPLGKHGVNDIFIDDDKYIPNLARLASAIKENGAVAGIQLNHGGRMAGKLHDGQLKITAGKQPVAPSAIAFPFPGFVVPRELTVGEFQELEDRFAEAARRMKDAGFDLVSIHCSHQYLIEQTLSPNSNKRKDEYGGDLERRMHFLLEIIRKTKKKIGDDFPLICRMSGMEYAKGGITVEDAKQIARKLENAGISALNVSHGANPAGLTSESVSPLTIKPKRQQRGELVHLAAPIKEVVSIPVMTVGRIITPALAEEIISQGKADLVCIGRGLITDPEWANKAKQGREKEIRHCIACEYCFTSVLGSPLTCTVNAALGKEKAYKLNKAPRSKQVFIAGGGPAGMEAARVAAIRGHNVTLFEKERLGGQINMATLPPGKDEFQLILNYLEEQINNLPVRVENQELTREIIDQKKPDVVILAAGAKPLKPRIKGIDNKNVLTAWQVLKGEMPRTENVVVIGGGATGAETAELLSLNGNNVTIVEKLDEIIGEVRSLPFYYLGLSKTLKLLNIEIITGITVQEITDNAVIGDVNGKPASIKADKVVLAIGIESENSLSEQLADLDMEIYAVGDCAGIGQLSKAIREGFHAGLSV